jgi:hypothetical protein
LQSCVDQDSNERNLEHDHASNEIAKGSGRA